MWAKNNGLWVSGSSGGGVPTYDATGAGLTPTTGASAAAFSFSHTAAAAADIFLAVQTNWGAQGNVTSPTFNGTALTQIGFIGSGNAFSSYGGLWVFRGAKMGTGSAGTVGFTAPPSNSVCAQSVSYTGVNSVGAAVTNYGESAAPSTGALALGSGTIILGVIGSGNYNQGRTMSSPTGGTNRSLQNNGAASLAISDSAASVTFGATMNSALSFWGTCGFVLS